MVAPEDVRRIAAIGNPVLRNLEITHAYSLLAAELAASGGANWCTFATWASRQAGSTIRGEDALELLKARLGGGSLLHPVSSAGRRLLRKGLFDRASRLGRLTARLHTPFDALELASDAVARGNLKVFAEIGYEFARYRASDDLDAFLAGLRDGDPPDGQRLLKAAFTRYAAGPDAQGLLLANLEIGLHEQTRLQPEIREALDAAHTTLEDLGLRLCPAARPRVRRAVATLALPAQRALDAVSREILTESLMVLRLPGRTLALGTDLADPYPEDLRELSDTELIAFVGIYEPAGPDHSGAVDWSVLAQRMHYIVHLFRAFHHDPALTSAPFTPTQVEDIEAGRIPEGDL